MLCRPVLVVCAAVGGCGVFGAAPPLALDLAVLGLLAGALTVLCECLALHVVLFLVLADGLLFGFLL